MGAKDLQPTILQRICCNSPFKISGTGELVPTLDATTLVVPVMLAIWVLTDNLAAHRCSLTALGCPIHSLETRFDSKWIYGLISLKPAAHQAHFRHSCGSAFRSKNPYFPKQLHAVKMGIWGSGFSHLTFAKGFFFPSGLISGPYHAF